MEDDELEGHRRQHQRREDRPAARGVLAAATVSELLTPPALPPGGRIGVVALASPIAPERLEQGLAALRACGFEVVLGEHVLVRSGHHAGAPADRAADLHALFDWPDIDAIFCARGGSSSIRVLEHLDFELIRAHPKVFVGYSDITTVMLALLARSGLRSFFGPMLAPDWANGLAAGAQDNLWRLICRASPAGALDTSLPGPAASPRRIRGTPPSPPSPDG